MLLGIEFRNVNANVRKPYKPSRYYESLMDGPQTIRTVIPNPKASSGTEDSLHYGRGMPQ